MKRKFEKGYLPNFSKEIFTVSKQIPRYPPDVYEVEEVLKKKGKGKNEQYFVKWLGYPSKFNLWIPASQLKNI